ncbi:MAG: hypothetical protein WA052_01930 [Microgenomates group bacterium]
MPYVFLRNLPEHFMGLVNTPREIFSPATSTADMYAKIAEAASCEVDGVEIHLSSETYTLLNLDGSARKCPNVHGEVEWHGSENRDLKVKQTIADAIQQFLNLHLAGEGFDLTFHDSPAGTFFVEKGGKSVLIQGGEAIPPNKVLAQVAYEVLGHETPGVITND